MKELKYCILVCGNIAAFVAVILSFKFFYDLWNIKRIEKILAECPYTESVIVDTSYWFRKNNPAYRVIVKFDHKNETIISNSSEWITQEEWPSLLIGVTKYQLTPTIGDRVVIRYAPENPKQISLSSRSRLEYFNNAFRGDAVWISILLFFVILSCVIKKVPVYRKT